MKFSFGNLRGCAHTHTSCSGDDTVAQRTNPGLERINRAVCSWYPARSPLHWYDCSRPPVNKLLTVTNRMRMFSHTVNSVRTASFENESEFPISSPPSAQASSMNKQPNYISTTTQSAAHGVKISQRIFPNYPPPAK